MRDVHPNDDTLWAAKCCIVVGGDGTVATIEAWNELVEAYAVRPNIDLIEKTVAYTEEVLARVAGSDRPTGPLPDIRAMAAYIRFLECQWKHRVAEGG